MGIVVAAEIRHQVTALFRPVLCPVQSRRLCCCGRVLEVNVNVQPEIPITARISLRAFLTFWIINNECGRKSQPFSERFYALINHEAFEIFYHTSRQQQLKGFD